MTMRRLLLVTIFTISATKGVPVGDYGQERDGLMRDFLRSPEYQHCIQNIFMPGSIPEQGSRDESGSTEESPQIFQLCVTEAFNQYLENQNRKGPIGPHAKRSANPSDEETSVPGGGSSGSSGSGSPGTTSSEENQYQQCMQNAFNLPGGASFPGFGGGNIPVFGGKNKRSPSDGENSGSNGFGMPNFPQNQFQPCMQNAVSVPGGGYIPGFGNGNKSKRSANAGYESTSEGSGGDASGPETPGSSGGSGSGSPGTTSNQQNQYQQCMQNAFNLPGGASFPGFGGGNIPVFGGKNKRSPSDGENSGSNGFGMPNFPQNQFQPCMQNAVSVPGGGYIPGFGNGNKSKRSANAGYESTSEGSGGEASGPETPGSSGGSGSGSPGTTSNQENQYQQCMQNAFNLPGGANFPGFGGGNIPVFGGKNKRSPSDGENSGSNGFGMPNFPQNQFQPCMQNAVSVPGGGYIPGFGNGNKSKRSANAGYESTSEGSGGEASGPETPGSSGGSGSGSPGTTSNQENQYQQCMQNAFNLPGGANFPGFGGGNIPVFGGKNKRSPSDGENSGSNGFGMPNFPQNQFQPCMQNAVSVPGGGYIPGFGNGNKSKRSANAGYESTSEGSGGDASGPETPGSSGGSGSGSPGTTSNQENQYQQCMQNAFNLPGGASFPGFGGGNIPVFGGKNKRSPSDGENSGSNGFGMPNFPQNQFQPCMQNAVSVPGGGYIPGFGNGNKSKRSANAGYESTSEGSGGDASGPETPGSSGGSGSGSPGTTSNQENQYQQCMQNAFNLPGGANFPGFGGGNIPVFGGKNKRSPSDGENSGSNGFGMPNFSQNQFQSCMQNAVSGPGGSNIPGFGNGNFPGLGSRDLSKRSTILRRSPYDSTSTMRVSYLTYSKVH